MLSLSSHEPFDVPFGNKKLMGEDALFLNSCAYTDSCLGNFIQQAKNKSWWNNTLIIITADHGHRFPFNSSNYEKGKFKIPMLWLGGAVANAMRIGKMGSQTDIASTLLGQLRVADPHFIFSKDLFSLTTNSFAVYSFNNGFGYLSPTTEMVYDFDLRNYLKPYGNEKDVLNGKAYMQVLFNDYNNR